MQGSYSPSSQYATTVGKSRYFVIFSYRRFACWWASLFSPCRYQSRKELSARHSSDCAVFEKKQIIRIFKKKFRVRILHTIGAKSGSLLTMREKIRSVSMDGEGAWERMKEPQVLEFFPVLYFACLWGHRKGAKFRTKCADAGYYTKKSGSVELWTRQIWA